MRQALLDGVGQLKPQALTAYDRCLLKRTKRDRGVIQVQQAVQGRLARLHAGRHGRSSQTLFPHGALDLFRQQFLDRLFRTRFEQAPSDKKSSMCKPNIVYKRDRGHGLHG
jgi:hypothetical protein